MSDNNIDDILKNYLSGLDDDIVDYLITIVSDMTIEERRSYQELNNTISPFLIDSEIITDQEEIEVLCKKLVKEFGGSGYQSSFNNNNNSVDATLTLLEKPVKIIDKTDFNKKKESTGGAVLTNASSSNQYDTNNSDNFNSDLIIKNVPTTQKQLRKMKKENERLQKILRAEEIARMQAEAEMSAARMAAIKANRSGGRQATTGVSVERFSLPHPSGTSDLLTDVALVLATGRRYGLVGKNGAGKSTLMRYLATYKLPDLMHLRILLVDQHVEGDEDSPMQWVLRADVERTALLEDEHRLLEAQSRQEVQNPLPATDNNTVMNSKQKKSKSPTLSKNPPKPPQDNDNLVGVDIELALSEVYDRMDVIGVRSAEDRARSILRGLGFTDDMLMEPTRNLSGGWAMRAALASALYIQPDLLLLDEPTNHLDLHALVWLENWLTEKFGGIVFVVSHDKVFLNSVCTDIYELNSTLAGQSKSTLTHYSGDYITYENTKKELKINQERLRESYQKEKTKLQEFISREGKKYDNPSHQAQRKMKMKQLQKLIEVESIDVDSELVITLPEPYGVFRNNEILISVRDVAFGWDSSNLLFNNTDFIISSQSRIAIMGRNGCGKTSLLDILVGDMPPVSGTVTRNVGCRIARLQQHHYKGEQLDPSLNSLEHLRRLPQEETTSVGLHDPDTRQEETAQRSYLSCFGITGNTALIPVRYLSGGQRMRIAMAVAFYRRPDLLILDEPTNHLDADTVRALCEALSTFKGAIVAVSHDESFVNQVIGKNENTGDKGNLEGELWVLSKKQLKRFDGSFGDYKKIIAKKALRE